MPRTVFAILLFIASPLFAVPGVKSPVNLRTVKPQYWNGRCPHEFHFAGTITSRGAGDVQFTWDRSDGASSPIDGGTPTNPQNGADFVDALPKLSGMGADSRYGAEFHSLESRAIPVALSLTRKSSRSRLRVTRWGRAVRGR